MARGSGRTNSATPWPDQQNPSRTLTGLWAPACAVLSHGVWSFAKSSGDLGRGTQTPPVRTIALPGQPTAHELSRRPLTFPSVLSWKLSTRAASVHLAATRRAAFRRRSWKNGNGGQ